LKNWTAQRADLIVLLVSIKCSEVAHEHPTKQNDGKAVGRILAREFLNAGKGGTPSRKGGTEFCAGGKT
jgi:hypothetical protein